MRITLILLIFCSSLWAPAQTVFNSSKTFLLKGKIDHYQPGTGNRFFTIKTYNIAGKHVDNALPIREDGSFEGRLFQPFSSDVEADYEDIFFKLYATPGDSLQVTIDGATWKQAAAPADAMQLQGRDASLIRDILAFEDVYNKHSFTTAVDWKDRTKSDEEVVHIRLKRMKDELSFADDYLQTHKIGSPIFRDWVRNDILYTAGFDITFTSFTGSRNRTLTIDQLTTLLKDIPVNGTAALHNTMYYNYIRLLQSDVVIIVNINKEFDAEKKQYGLNSLPIYLNQIDAHFNGLAKQLMYYQCYVNNYRYVNGYETRFDATIRDPYIIDQWEEGKAKLVKPFEALNVLQALDDFKADAGMKSRLRSIFEGQKGKYVFITFWGTWCGPCMSDMPGFPAFISQFKDNAPVFLFLGVDTKEEASKKVQKKYGIRGQFITLNNDETTMLNSILKFRSYPTHFLLKPNSETTSYSIGRVKQDNSINMDAVKRMKQILVDGKE